MFMYIRDNVVFNIVSLSPQGTASVGDAQQFQHPIAVAGRKMHQRYQMAVGLV